MSTPTKLRKLTPLQLLQKFPDIVRKLETAEDGQRGAVEDMACPHCGNTDRFKIEVKTLVSVSAYEEEDEGDHEWDDQSYCQCAGAGPCNHYGKVRDFTFKGLDDLVEEIRDLCDCQDRSWHGPDHDTACGVTLKLGKRIKR